MLNLKSLSAVLAALLLLTSCAAALVPAGDDPVRKLQQAQDLFDNRDRPLPAERMITEAISVYKDKQDTAGLIEGYRIYGLFLRSPSVGRSEQHYRQYGFQDPEVEFATRFNGALRYFERAAVLAKANSNIDILPNLYLNTALTYQVQGDGARACQAFDDSMRADQVRSESGQRKKVILPREYASFQQGIADLKRKAGCAG